MTKFCILLLVVFIAGCGGGSGAAFHTRYVLTDLGTLPSSGGSGAIAINNKGQVVGWSVIQAVHEHAFLWNPTTPNGTVGSMVDLGTAGYDYSGANDINDLGDVVGVVGDNQFQIATLWHAGATLKLAPDTAISRAYGINSAGDVVGYQTRDDGIQVPTIWSGGQSRTLASLPGFERGIATSINDAGAIVGACYSPSEGWHNTFFEPAKDIIESPAIDETDAQPAINGRGDVIGGTSWQGASRGFIFRNNSLELAPTKWFPHRFRSINEGGLIVGDMGVTACVFVGSDAIALDTRVKLPPGAHLIKATGINNAGQIVGEMLGPSHAFLLTPVRQ